MSSWASLPAELRVMVFSHLLDDDTKPPYTTSLLATICREWQWFFEKWNFRELVLSQHHLKDFNKLLKRKHSYRLAYVKKLRFKVLLDKYDCDSCQTGEDEPTIRRNCVVFTRAIRNLLKVLAQNTRPALNESYQCRLCLDLSVHSPSDCEHSFRPWCLQDDYPYQHSDFRWLPMLKTYTELPDPQVPSWEVLRRRRHEEQLFHDVPHGWNDGIFTIPEATGLPDGSSNENVTQSSARGRLFGTRPLKFDFSGQKRRLPRASIVRWLVIRRNNFRGISPEVIFKLIHESFPLLWTLRIEKWLEIYPEQQAGYQTDFARLLAEKGFPRELAEFDWLEDHDAELQVAAAPRDTDLGYTLARASRRLERLSATWQVDAETFFSEYFDSSWAQLKPNSLAMAPWEQLIILSLTSTAITGSNTRKGRDAIRHLLRAACRAARLMPQLISMQIWDCRDGPASTAKAACFMYEAGTNNHPPVIAWHTSFPAKWTLAVKDSGFDCWRKLARERDLAGREAVVHHHTTDAPWSWIRFSGQESVSHWGYIRILMLQPPAILDGTSFGEIAWQSINWPSRAR